MTTKQLYTRTLHWSEQYGYHVQIRNHIYPLADQCLTVTLPVTLYALPNNEAHRLNTKINLPSAHDITKVMQYWGKYPIGLSVEGYIDRDRFVVVG
jgi:hypothetical protein